MRFEAGRFRVRRASRHADGMSDAHGAHPAPHTHSAPDPDLDAATFWERRYADADAVWSGRVNATLAAVVADIEQALADESIEGSGADEGGRAAEPIRGADRTAPAPSTATGETSNATVAHRHALDLGCGEGGDAVWLAGRAGASRASTCRRRPSSAHARPLPQRDWATIGPTSSPPTSPFGSPMAPSTSSPRAFCSRRSTSRASRSSGARPRGSRRADGS